MLLCWPLSMRPRHYDRFVLIGLCWLYGRSEFPPPPPKKLVLAVTGTAFPSLQGPYYQLYGLKGPSGCVSDYIKLEPPTGRLALQCRYTLLAGGGNRGAGGCNEVAVPLCTQLTKYVTSSISHADSDTCEVSGECRVSLRSAPKFAWAQPQHQLA